ncbi:hypothetical protein BGX33_007122 [Mortierella sp. NVP41]|nr:hypothetical protein BGX33_007122 [Mortierella sp. NVP41]
MGRRTTRARRLCRMAAKKLAKKERQLQKQLQKQEQQRQQQQQQKLRCLCYLDTSLDNAQQQQQQQQPQKQHSSKVSSWHPQKKEKEKDKNKDKEAAGRLKRIWNESAIFSWSKPPGSSGSRQSSSSAASSHPTSSSGVGYHHHAIAGGESSLQANNSQVDVSNGSVSGGGVPMRHSMSGTDISDEGNHSLSDVEDDLDIIENLRHQHHQHHRHGTTNHTAAASSNSINNNNNNYSHHRVSFQGPYGTSSAKASAASSRPKDDLKAIARHQAEIGLQRQEPVEGEEDFSYGVMEDDDHHVLVSLTPAPPPPPPALSSFGNHITVNNDEADDDDDDEEDWDSRSDSGAPSSSLMYSADVREPSCRSTLALPMSTPANNRAYLKKPSNANLGGSVRGRQRCLSLPADTVGQPGGGGFLMSSKSSESWDEDFDIESADIHVPTKVVENQMSLQMDLYNIKDFASQIEDLKTLRASLRMASSSLKATNPKKHKDLSMLFQRDWEQAEVIIDLGEIAQTSGPTTTASSTTTSSSSGPASLQHTGKKPSEPSLASLSTSGGGGGLLSKQPSMRLHRPALSTSAPAHNNGLSALQSMQQQQQQVRSEFQSSILTGTMLAPGDTESDGATASGQSTRNSSRASSSLSASLKVNTEVAVEGTKMSQAPNSPPSVDTGRTTVGGVRMRQASSCMKESCSSPAGLGLCTSSMTPLRNGTITSTSTNSNDDYEDSDDGDLEIKYESGSIGLFRFPEGEQPLGGEGFKGGFHDKEDSSATVKPLRSSAGGSPRSPREGGFQAKMEASFRPHQKYSHHPKRRTHTGGMPNTRRLPNEDNYVHDEDDDGYESYGYGDGSSIGVFTPIPSDRHMQVLKDILMEGLGTEVARQYMFKQGEQDHVRFSVEVIPGLLGHLKGLQQRLGVQLMELQQLTVIV